MEADGRTFSSSNPVNFDHNRGNPVDSESCCSSWRCSIASIGLKNSKWRCPAWESVEWVCSATLVELDFRALRPGDVSTASELHLEVLLVLRQVRLKLPYG